MNLPQTLDHLGYKILASSDAWLAGESAPREALSALCCRSEFLEYDSGADRRGQRLYAVFSGF